MLQKYAYFLLTITLYNTFYAGDTSLTRPSSTELFVFKDDSQATYHIDDMCNQLKTALLAAQEFMLSSAHASDLDNLCVITKTKVLFPSTTRLSHFKNALPVQNFLQCLLLTLECTETKCVTMGNTNETNVLFSRLDDGSILGEYVHRQNTPPTGELYTFSPNAIG